MNGDLDDILIGAARFNQLEKVIDLIEQGANPNVDDSLPLFWASKNANMEMVRYLIPLCDVSAWHNEALRIACENKHWQICQTLLPHCNPVDPKSQVNPIQLACEMGWSDIVSDYLDQYTIDAVAQINQMWEDNCTPSQIAVLENIVQARVLHKKIGEALSLSNSNTIPLSAKRKI